LACSYVWSPGKDKRDGRSKPTPVQDATTFKMHPHRHPYSPSCWHSTPGSVILLNSSHLRQPGHPLSSTVTNLGVRFDPHLTFNAHIKHLCKTSFYHLRNISKLRPTLTLSDAEKLVHAFISSRLDYCNSLFYGITGKNIQKLQYIQNSAARILMRVRKYEHITPILHSLHWLPVSFRIDYKVLILTHTCINGHAPPYLQE